MFVSRTEARYRSGEGNRLPHIDPRIAQQLRDGVLFHARGVELNPHRALFRVEMHPPDAVDLAHRVNRTHFVFARNRTVIEIHFKISHGFTPFRPGYAESKVPGLFRYESNIHSVPALLS